MFHEVIIVRDKRDLVLSMLFSYSDLYIGSLPYLQSGLVIYENGEPLPQPLKCVRGQRRPDRLGSSYKTELYRYDTIGSLSSQYTRSQWVMSVTFKTENSQVRLKWYKRIYSFNITLEFRTHEETGLMMFHRFSSETFPELPCRFNHEP